MTATTEPIWTAEPTVVRRTTDPNHPLQTDIRLTLRNPAGGDPILVSEVTITVGDDLLFSRGGVQPGDAPEGWDLTRSRDDRNKFLAEPADGEALLLEAGASFTFALNELQVSQTAGSGHIHLTVKIEGKSEMIKQTLSVEKQEPAFALTLRANPPTVDPGDTVMLSWTLGVSDASLLLIGPDYKEGRAVTGQTQQEVHPRTTATYTLKATRGQDQRTESVTVQVTDLGDLYFRVRPTDSDVTAHVAALGVGDTALVRWHAASATSCNLAITVDTNETISIEDLKANAIDRTKPDEAVLPIECRVKLTDGKTLVVDATSAGGQKETFTVEKPVAKIIKFMLVPVKDGDLGTGKEIPVPFLKPKIVEFTGSSTVLDLGDTLKLTWKANHFESLVLTGAPGGLEKPLAAAGTLDLIPQDSTKYVLAAKGGAVVDKMERSVHIRGWRTLTPMPTGRTALAAVGTPDGCIYALGGTVSTPDGRSTRYTYLNTVEQYDPKEQKWKSMPPLLAGYSVIQAVALPDGKIYVFGLRPRTGGGTPAFPDSVAERYDPRTGTSVPIRPLEPYRTGVCAVGTPDGMIYAIGSKHGGGGGTTVDRYDPRTDAWSPAPPLCRERYFCGAAATADGSIYVFGGAWQKEIERRDPVSGQWSLGAAMPPDRGNFRAFAIGDQIYLFPETPDSEPIRYSVTSGTWQPLRRPPSPTTSHATALGADGKIYQMGGWTRGASSLTSFAAYSA